jgi:hypothetical protein
MKKVSFMKYLPNYNVELDLFGPHGKTATITLNEQAWHSGSFMVGIISGLIVPLDDAGYMINVCAQEYDGTLWTNVHSNDEDPEPFSVSALIKHVSNLIIADATKIDAIKATIE